LIVTGRRKEKINALANELSEAYHVNVEVIIVELSDNVELEALVERINNLHIDTLINNAGFGINSTSTKRTLESKKRWCRYILFVL